MCEKHVLFAAVDQNERSRALGKPVSFSIFPSHNCRPDGVLIVSSDSSPMPREKNLFCLAQLAVADHNARDGGQGYTRFLCSPSRGSTCSRCCCVQLCTPHHHITHTKYIQSRCRGKFCWWKIRLPFYYFFYKIQLPKKSCVHKNSE